MRMLFLQRAADGGLELIHGARVVAERTELFEGGLAVRPLCVQEVEQAETATPVRELDGIARLRGLRQVDLAQRAQLLPLAAQRGERGVDFRQRLVDGG